MADIIQFPSRSVQQPRILITQAGEGFDVSVIPASSLTEDLTAFFADYDHAEAFAFGIYKACGFPIADDDQSGRAA